MSALELIDGWTATPCAAAVLVDGEIVDDRGAVHTELRWASVTKLVTALATLVAVDDGRIGLDDHAGPPGSTIRHLLAHASGLDYGRPVVLALPGSQRIYSNAGYELLASIVEERVDQSFEGWARDRVLEPLAMTSTTLTGSPASGMVGPVADLVGLVAELQRPTLVAPGTAELMRRVAFGGLAGELPGFGTQPSNDWALGPELRDSKRPHWTGHAASPSTFGHFGAAGGFVWIDPEANVACCCLTGTPFGRWAADAWPVLGDRVLDEHRRRGDP